MTYRRKDMTQHYHAPTENWELALRTLRPLRFKLTCGLLTAKYAKIAKRIVTGEIVSCTGWQIH